MFWGGDFWLFRLGKVVIFFRWFSPLCVNVCLSPLVSPLLSISLTVGPDSPAYTFIGSEKYLFLTLDYAVVVEVVGLGGRGRQWKEGECHCHKW